MSEVKISAENIPKKPPAGVTTLEDLNLIAFLELRGHIATPYIVCKPQGASRVAWDVKGDVKDDMKDYNSNCLVPIKDYVMRLKEKRADMFSLKRIEKQEREEREREGVE